MKSAATTMTRIQASADPIQVTIDAVAAAFEMRGATRMAERQLTRRTTIEVPLDAIAAQVQTMFDAVAAIAVKSRLDRGCHQTHRQQG